MNGGDNRTITPAGDVAQNNHFHHDANFRILGVGNIFRHNQINNNPLNSAWKGSDHLIEYNAFLDCMSDGDDLGALYAYQSIAGRGSIVRYNYFRNVFGRVDLHTGVAGIYLDGGTCGQVIYGNVFYKVGKRARAPLGGMFLHGAKDNLISNNVFIDCPIAIGFTDWADGRWKNYLKTSQLKDVLYKTVNINDSVYIKRYPNITKLSENASVNTILNNVMVNCAESFVLNEKVKAKHNMGSNLEISNNQVFVDYNTENFRLKPDAEVFQKLPEFKAIPFEKIGIEKK
jgi:hypothetical protein